VELLTSARAQLRGATSLMQHLDVDHNVPMAGWEATERAEAEVEKALRIARDAERRGV
jgi:hypothetical protein